MTKYLNAKYGIEILHDDGTTQILAGEGDPSVVGRDAGIGSIFMRSDNGGGLFTKTGEAVTAWSQIPISVVGGLIEYLAHNYGQYNGQWFPFTLDAQQRLRIAVEVVPSTHTLSGTYHEGILQDSQLSDNVVLKDEHYLLHDYNSYIEYERVNGKVVAMHEWVDSTKVRRISSTAIVRVDNKVVNTIKQIYDYNTGIEVVTTVTGTVYRENNKVKTISTELGI